MIALSYFTLLNKLKKKHYLYVFIYLIFKIDLEFELICNIYVKSTVRPDLDVYVCECVCVWEFVCRYENACHVCV